MSFYVNRYTRPVLVCGNIRPGIIYLTTSSHDTLEKRSAMDVACRLFLPVLLFQMGKRIWSMSVRIRHFVSLSTRFWPICRATDRVLVRDAGRSMN